MAVGICDIQPEDHQGGRAPIVRKDVCSRSLPIQTRQTRHCHAGTGFLSLLVPEKGNCNATKTSFITARFQPCKHQQCVKGHIVYYISLATHTVEYHLGTYSSLLNRFRVEFPGASSTSIYKHVIAAQSEANDMPVTQDRKTATDFVPPIKSCALSLKLSLLLFRTTYLPI